MTVYTRADKRMVLIREMGSVPKISGDLAEMELFNSDERNSGRVKMGTNKLRNIAFSLGPQVAAQISADWSRLLVAAYSKQVEQISVQVLTGKGGGAVPLQGISSPVE